MVRLEPCSIVSRCAPMDPSTFSTTKVNALLRAAQACPEAQIEPELVHLFAEGIYGRQIFLPADAMAIGKVHLRDHITVVVGDISVYGPDGEERVTGFRAFVTRAGAQRTVYAHADSYWIAVHSNPDDSEDLALIEARNVTDDLSRALLPGHFVKELET